MSKKLLAVQLGAKFLLSRLIATHGPQQIQPFTIINDDKLFAFFLLDFLLSEGP